MDVSGIQKGSSCNGCKVGLQQCLGSLKKRNRTDMSSPSTNMTFLRQKWGGSSFERLQGETKNGSNASRKWNLTLFLCWVYARPPKKHQMSFVWVSLCSAKKRLALCIQPWSVPVMKRMAWPLVSVIIHAINAFLLVVFHGVKLFCFRFWMMSEYVCQPLVMQQQSKRFTLLLWGHCVRI